MVFHWIFLFRNFVKKGYISVLQSETVEIVPLFWNLKNGRSFNTRTIFSQEIELLRNGLKELKE